MFIHPKDINDLVLRIEIEREYSYRTYEKNDYIRLHWIDPSYIISKKDLKYLDIRLKSEYSTSAEPEELIHYRVDPNDIVKIPYINNFQYKK